MKDYGVALVTGAGAGLGRAIALELAARGARVVVADIDRAGSAETVGMIHAAGGRAIGQEMNVTDPASVEAAFVAAEAWDKAVDVLVNNAGVLNIAPFLTFSLADWNRVIGVNVTGSFLCAQRAGRAMAEQGYGRIINLASISGVRAGVGRTAYGTSKAAVIGLTRQIALELGPFGVTANAIAPGAIKTGMIAANYSEETIRRLLPMVPVGKLGDPVDIARAVAFLASPESGYVNGEILAVDGGYLAAGMTQTGSLDLKDMEGATQT